MKNTIWPDIFSIREFTAIYRNLLICDTIVIPLKNCGITNSQIQRPNIPETRYQGVYRKFASKADSFTKTFW